MVLKLQFYRLNYFPISGNTVCDIWAMQASRTEDMGARVQGIWREHGWPPAEDAVGTFNKDASLAHVARVLKAEYSI